MKELLSHNLRVDFFKFQWLWFALSLALIAGSLVVWFSKGEDKYGIDFSGGHELLVKFSAPVTSDDIRSALDKNGLGEARVQAFQGDTQEFSIRLGGLESSQGVKEKVEAALKPAFTDKFQIAKADFVGPTVGNELRWKALVAIGVSLIGILIYIAFRFEFAVGLGSIVALAHDVIIATGMYLVAGHTISMATLAAALTIVGYSVNDTVVVFDRVREERQKRKNYHLRDVVNESINFTLSRTIITHVLTLFSALALYLFGGGEIADLSLYLVAGIICGAYSTIFIVSPVVIMWEQFRGRAGSPAAAATVPGRV